jgi:hypothetical protein
MDRLVRRGCAVFLTFVLLVLGLPAPLAGTQAQTAGADDAHPRLWLTASDLPRLRSWAVESNPFWQDGLLVLAERLKGDMDSGAVPNKDTGSDSWEEFPTESYAELFAFMSLVHPDEAVRTDYAQRARTLLMYVMNQAVKGPNETAPFQSPEFQASSKDRARWWGEGFPLTVDWIYPSLSAEDKTTIRTVFLRWSDEIVQTGYHHPEPVGLTNDSALLADPAVYRWGVNNYVTAHMRNLGLMALALDPADDPGGKLGAYLSTAVGAHLYMADYLMRNDAAGGLMPEGFEYGPQTLAYLAQFLLALQTSGNDDPNAWGPQANLAGNQFWNDLIPAFLNSLSSRTVLIPEYEYKGPVYQPAWYGDGFNYWVPDMIESFGPLGIYDQRTGNADRLNAVRWIQTNVAPGGAEMISERASDPETFLDSILYFMLFDPAAAPPTDPRPETPPVVFASGIGKLLARTGWGDDASWFTYGLGWKAIDHQHGDGNGFELYRNGEWLTKLLVGYGTNIDAADPANSYYFPGSDHQNTLSLENDPPDHNEIDDYRHMTWLHGSQWQFDAQADPVILAMSIQPGFIYALGDATNLYDSAYELSTDITQANRSVVWLAPDTIVVYDRATSKTADRFKRFWLNLPADATVSGSRTTMLTAGGQQLAIDTLLPAGAVPSVAPLDIQLDNIATGDPTRYQFVVEAPGAPADARFLNVLQAGDAGATLSPAQAFASDDGSYAGVLVDGTAVLFPVTLGTTVQSLTYTLPAAANAQIITGLVPGASYDVRADQSTVSVTTGSAHTADAGGVLVIGDIPAVLDTAPLAFVNAPIVPPATPVSAEETEEPSVETAASPEAGTPVPLPTAVEGGAVATGEGQIVYKTIDTETANGHLFVIDAAAGAQPRDLSLELDKLSPGTDDWINVSADGSTFVLATERFDPQCKGWACLAVVPADLSGGTVVTVDGEAIHPDSRAAISPDGSAIVFPKGGGPHELDLWVTIRSGDAWSAPVLLTGNLDYQYSDSPAFSPDGKRIAFTCGNQPYGGEGTAICWVNADGSRLAEVISGLHPYLHPAFSPDGSLLFATDRGIARLVAGSDGSDPIGLAFSNDNAPCALPDGRIASLWIDRPGGSGRHELKVMSADGTSYVMLVTDQDIEDIGCSAR